MNSKKNSTGLNERHEKALDELKEKNQDIIKEVKKLSQEYGKHISSFDKDMKTFWDFMNQMEKANSHYPIGHYAHYYYKNLEEPISESFISPFGKKNPQYGPLTLGGKKNIERQLPDYEKYNNIISEYMKIIRLVVKKATSSNIIVIRIAGISGKHNELEKLDENWWYPEDIATSKQCVKSVVTYDPHLPIKIPYHRQLLIKYDALYGTATILKYKLNEIEKILETINSFLPFAELLPPDKIPQTIVNVEASANNNSINVGDDVKFGGDAVVGKDAELKKD